jgi:hypothetical protein
MRKRLISANPRDRVSSDEGGLDLANLGMVEITSEDEAYPIECALQLGERLDVLDLGGITEDDIQRMPAAKARTKKEQRNLSNAITILEIEWLGVQSVQRESFGV